MLQRLAYTGFEAMCSSSGQACSSIVVASSRTQPCRAVLEPRGSACAAGAGHTESESYAGVPHRLRHMPRVRNDDSVELRDWYGMKANFSIHRAAARSSGNSHPSLPV